MKTITLKITVPKWAKWVAQDRDGEVYIYKECPTSDDGDTFYPARTGDWQRIAYTGIVNPNWRKTLRRIK